MKATFSFVVGAFVRKTALFQIQKAAQTRGLSFNAIDDGGWISREYNIIVEGEEAMVRDYVQSVEKWATGVSTG